MKQIIPKLFVFLVENKPGFAIARLRKKVIFCLLFFFLVSVSALFAQVASVNIAITAGANPSCSGSSITFTATPTNGGTSPSFQWKVNGANVGTNSSTYSSSSLINSQIVSCLMTSNLAGVSGSPATSNSISVIVNPIVAPSVTISTTSPTTVCPGGNQITFIATSINGGTSPTYVWKKNGSQVQGSGVNGPSFSTWFPSSGQVIVTCEMTSNSACASFTLATSNSIIITVINTQPTISISTPSASVCQGTPVTFSAQTSHIGNMSYIWKVNGNAVGINSNQYTTSSLSNGQTVTCEFRIYDNSCPVIASPDGIGGGTNQPGNTLGEPYPTLHPGDRQQFLIHASALTNSGMAAGIINSLSFYLDGTVGNPSNLQDYSIRMAQTSLIDLPGITFVTPTIFTNVFGPTTYAPVLNAKNTHTFFSPFYWDGVSNVLIDICFRSFNGSGSFTSFKAYQNFFTGYNSASSAIDKYDFSPCSQTTSSGGWHQRPVMTFSEFPLKIAFSNSISMVVANPSIASVSMSASATTICAGSSVTFTASPLNGGATPSYQWKVNGVNAGTNSSTFTITSLTNGQSVTCILTSSAGCASPVNTTSNSIAITVITGVSAAGAINGLSSFCAWLPVQYSVAAIAGATTYNWSVPAGATISNGQGTNQITVAFPNTVSSGTISVYGVNGPCSGVSSSLPITVLSTPNIPTSSDAVGCSGSPITLNGIPSGGTWSVPNPYTGPSTSFYYTLTNSNSCSASSLLNTGLSNLITVNPLPSVAAADVSGCAGTAIALSGTPAGGTWSLANPYTGSTSTSYTHSYTNANGCSNTSAPATITINPLPTATISSGATVVCSGGSITLSANTGTRLSYQWKLNTNAISGAIAATYAAIAAGSYTCTVTNSCGSITSNVIALTNGVLPTATITASGATSFCQGGSVTLSTSTASGYTYQWKVNGVAVTGATSPTYVATTSGTHKCTTTNSCGNITSNIITVTVFSPTASITASGSTTFCGGGSAVLSAIAADGQTYIWKKDGTTISGATAATYTANSTGNFKCVVSNSCGTSTSNVIAVMAGVPAKPPKITGTTKVCPNTSYTYSVASISTATSYSWIVPAGATVTAGQGTAAVILRYGTAAGNISCAAINVCGTGIAKTIATSFNCTPSREQNNLENEVNQEAKIKVFPNPSENGIFTVDFENSNVHSMQVFDMLGKEIFLNNEVNSLTNYTLNLTQFPKGVYALKLQGPEINEVIRIQK